MRQNGWPATRATDSAEDAPRAGIGAQMPQPGHYLPRLDGLRGICVLAVMLFHFGYLPPGWIGVQVFFVLSGYLITLVLIRGRGRLSLPDNLGRFFQHRALRILPVMVVLLAVSTVLYVTLGFPQSYARDWPWLVSFLANFARLREGDLGGFHVHLWSLAVEEQFYLLWPFAVLLLPERHLKRVVVCVLLLAPLFRFMVFNHLYEPAIDNTYAGIVVYVLPFSQFDAFCAGAALALWPVRDQARLGRLLGGSLLLLAMGGLLTLAWGHFYSGGAYFPSFGYSLYLIPSHAYVWGYSLLNVVSALLIGAAAVNHAWTAVLGFSPLRAVGRISYGVYVYHLPLLVLGDHYLYPRLDAPNAAWRFGFFVLWCAVVLTVSHLSHRYIEAPLLSLKSR